MTIKAIRPRDPHFTIHDGFVLANRAGFELSKSCPAEYKSMLLQAMNAGWIKPIAHVTQEEYMIMQLSQ